MPRRLPRNRRWYYDPTYGCVKPVTASTLTNHELVSGQYGTVYDHVLFTGGTGTNNESGNGRVVGIDMQTGWSDIHDIFFRYCVFQSRPSVRGNAVHFWNCATDGAKFYNIYFDHCWFEQQPRMGLEVNGRGGWWHDVYVDHCTFEPSGLQNLSFDMSPVDGNPVTPFGIDVGGVVRGVENVHVTHNDLQGAGINTIGGFAPYTSASVEFRCNRKYSVDGSGGCTFHGNKIGLVSQAWMNFSPPDEGGCFDLTMTENLIDFYYNPTNAIYPLNGNGPWDGAISDSYFADNVYNFGSGNNEPANFMILGDGVKGDNNVFLREQYNSPSAWIGGNCSMPFTGSTFTDCHFHLPKAVTFEEDAVGSGNVFDHGYVNGTFV